MHLKKQTKAFVSPAPVSSAFEMVFSAFPGTLALLPHHLSSLFSSRIYHFGAFPDATAPCYGGEPRPLRDASVRIQPGSSSPSTRAAAPPSSSPQKKAAAGILWGQRAEQLGLAAFVCPAQPHKAQGIPSSSPRQHPRHGGAGIPHLDIWREEPGLFASINK